MPDSGIRYMANKVYFAENLRHLRKQRGLSQVELAKELGVTRSRIGSYEEKRSEPSLEVVVRIAEYLGLPVEVLITNNLAQVYTKVTIKDDIIYSNGL